MSELEDALEDFDEDALPDADDEPHEWWTFESADEMAEAVVGDIRFIIESALDARGQALIALPVSDEALPVLTALAAADVKWKDVTIVPTDDALVSVDDPRSHVKTLAGLFMTRGARVLPIATELDDISMAGGAADARLQDVHWPPDLVWLGMDDHGGTAGIVDSADMEEALETDKRAAGLMPDGDHPGADVGVVTLTKAAIVEARTVMVLLSNPEAQTRLEAAIEEGAVGVSPIGRVFADLTVPVDIYVAPGAG